ncbi:MAG: sensor histidine kinase [Hydrogenophaga sp.]|jgi:two-component system sensor histidine kinase PhcS|uniref:sensor histidine kinase n=1 Tax=Hydrogenophaga sp. TaxID=1904254 RepID=UPI001D1E26DC|nr:ATP-binding protein [Hydrogenophaga sp.]MBW0170776.1 two-component sensor histidine kinase [Hydrogenophaga sp.]MBW0183474.1 two-component sensor histidine kinase [Hydrogenophaga sp.]
MVNRPSTPYEQQLSDFRLAYSKAGSITSIVLVLAGFGLDYFSYPERLLEFSLLRLLVVLLTLGVLRLLFTDFGRLHVRSLTMLWLLLPQIMIAFMIYETDGAQSIYFVGLHLALYAVGIILPISFFEGIGFGVVTLVLYVVACALHPDAPDSGPRMVTNSLFILFSAAASAVCTWFNEKARLRLFQLQHEVSEKNASLREINATLAEVKGQLIQREKMAAIGTLSAGLLHELNNPVNYSLMAINMGLTCKATASDEMLKESLTDAREGMQRIQNIVTDLKTFAYQKPGQDSQRPFLLENAVRSAVRLAGYELKGIDVPIELPQDTHVLGDEPAIIGVLINLLSNAALALQAAKREHPRIAVKVTQRGERLGVSVRDNGTGIDPANLGRVFEPFFTTRDVGAGLGLGLSVSYGIVQRHGGTLAVESEPGQWTEFTFDLPRP